jgi:hypothetical protein
MTHYDARLTPMLTIAVSGDSAIVAYDGDLTLPARITLADLPALRRALSVWEVANGGDTELSPLDLQGLL